MTETSTTAETGKPRRRWFQFSLRTLLIGVTVAAVFCAVFSRLDFREPRLVVKEILAADMPPETRMKALTPYIDIGRPKNEIDKLLGDDGPDSFIGYGPGFCSVYYKSGLSVDYNPDGTACSIAYCGRDGKKTILRSDDPVTWPKTTGGKNALLRAGRAGSYDTTKKSSAIG